MLSVFSPDILPFPIHFYNTEGVKAGIGRTAEIYRMLSTVNRKSHILTDNR